MCFATWSNDRYLSPYSDRSLEMLKELGVEYVQIVVTQYQEHYNSTKIIRTELTPSDKSVIHAIRKANKLGLKVMLKPHIDLINKDGSSYWRADIGFQNEADWEKWFKSYKKFITHYANIGEKNLVDVFCVGTELSFTTQKPEYWLDIIAGVRTKFSGSLTYAANWDNYRNIKFWGNLDFVGIDAYFPLSYNSEPSQEDLSRGWQKWINEIEGFHAETDKPIVFTEIGYSSSAHAASDPWRNGEGNADVEMQAKCYNAFFKEVWGKEWLAGVYWWKWAPSIHGGGKYNRRFTPLNKPSAQLIKKHYTSRRKISRAALAPAEPELLREDVKKMVPLVPESREFEAGDMCPSMRISTLKFEVFSAEKLKVPPMNYGTLLPQLRTQHSPEFKEEWTAAIREH
ncbi:MAG: hypothetical protein HQ594_04060 [Candidatus Omnitrophica bacterium]|nr:hypothetical protein [Candidatus Omnitrophota bacterium]